jgi:hypothetical protein
MRPEPTEPFNPYAPPGTLVEDPDPTLIGEPAYFPVGIGKLVVMSVLTFGMYEVYWFYRNWKAVQHSHKVHLRPFWRALFYPLTSYFLFQRIAAESARLGIGESLQISALAMGVFVISSLVRLPDPYWLLCLLSFLPLIPVQLVVNEINQRVAADVDQNRSFGVANFIGMIIGALLLVAVIAGMILYPDAGA